MAKQKYRLTIRFRIKFDVNSRNRQVKTKERPHDLLTRVANVLSVVMTVTWAIIAMLPEPSFFYWMICLTISAMTICLSWIFRQQ